MSLVDQCGDILQLILSYVSIKDIVKIETLAKKFNGVYNYTKVEKHYIKVEQTKYKLFHEQTEYLEAMRKEIIDTNNYKNLSKWGKIYRNINNQSGWWQFDYLSKDDCWYNEDAEGDQFSIYFNEHYYVPDEDKEEMITMIDKFVKDIVKKPVKYKREFPFKGVVYVWFCEKN